jgi:hypothetical protein
MMHVEQYENVGHAGEHQTTQEHQLGGAFGGRSTILSLE